MLPSAILLFWYTSFLLVDDTREKSWPLLTHHKFVAWSTKLREDTSRCLFGPQPPHYRCHPFTLLHIFKRNPSSHFAFLLSRLIHQEGWRLPACSSHSLWKRLLMCLDVFSFFEHKGLVLLRLRAPPNNSWMWEAYERGTVLACDQLNTQKDSICLPRMTESKGDKGGADDTQCSNSFKDVHVCGTL